MELLFLCVPLDGAICRAPPLGRLPAELRRQRLLKPSLNDVARPHGIFSELEGWWKLAGHDKLFYCSLGDAQALGHAAFENQLNWRSHALT